jgi:hypothetical protein
MTLEGFGFYQSSIAIGISSVNIVKTRGDLGLLRPRKRNS